MQYCRLNKRGLVVEDLDAKCEVNIGGDGNVIANDVQAF